MASDAFGSATFTVSVPLNAVIGRAKVILAERGSLAPEAISLYVGGNEHELDDAQDVAGCLAEAGAEGLFMLVAVLADDTHVLETLYRATGGAGWKNKKGWMTDADIGEWYGVTVNDEGRVTALTLYFNTLTGTIPPEISLLSELTELKLQNNALTGHIPAGIGELTALRQLIVSYNELTGVIPKELGQLAGLELLWVHCNQLTGTLPAELGKLTALTQLYGHSNQCAGTLPPEIGRLRSLKELYLNENQFTGPIPEELAQLGALHSLGLADNQFTETQEFDRLMARRVPDCQRIL
jgi:hypothetical protein